MVDLRDVGHERASGRSADAVALKVALLYAVVTTVWILGSGQLVLRLPPDVARVIEIYKGLGFTVVTTVLLFFATRGWARRFAAQVQSTRESELRTAQIVHAMPAGVLLVGTDGAIEFANPEAERVMGISASDMIGVPLELVLHPDDDANDDMFSLLRDGRVVGLNIRVGKGEQSVAMIASAARLGTADSGAGWILALSDVSHTHLENERIRTLVRGYRMLSAAMHAVQTARNTQQLLEAVAETIATDGVLAGTWAAAPDESGTRLVTVAKHGLTQPAVDRIEAAALHDPQYDRVEAGQQLSEGHLYVVNDIAADPLSPFVGLEPAFVYGSSATFVVSASDLPLAAVSFFSEQIGYFDQEQIRLVEILRDAIVFAVSKFELDAKRCEAEGFLERSENAYRQMFDKNPEPIWVYDVGTLGILAVNEAAVRKYGYTAEEFARMTLVDVQPAEDIPSLLDTVAHYSQGVPADGYFTHIDKGGHNFVVHVRSNSVNWNGVDARLALIQEVATVS